MKDELFVRLASVRRALAELLDALEMSSPSGVDERIGRSWRRLVCAFEELADAETTIADLEPVERERARREIDGIWRMRALVGASVERQERHTLELLERVRRTRRQLDYYQPASRAGSSVDLAG